MNSPDAKAGTSDIDFVKVVSDDEKIPVEHNERTVKDDLDDYIYLKSSRHKKKKRKSNSYDSYDNTTIVASDRESSSHHHKKHRSSRKKMKVWKKILISVLCTLLGVVILFVGTIAALWYKGSKEITEGDYIITAPEGVSVQNQGEYVVYNGKTYKYNDKMTSILFMGIDKNELEGTSVIGTGGQADVNVLMAMDTSTGKITLINISRDTMTDIAEYSAGGTYVGMANEQLCLAYAFGDGREMSCENQVTAVKNLFYNIPIKSYFSLDLDGIVALNDCVGGVDVVSPETIGEFTEGESYHLEGKTAENFVRTRSHSTADANSYRMQRQQVYLQSLVNKVIAMTKEDISVPLDLFDTASQYSCTNINASKVCYLASMVVSSPNLSYEMLSVPGQAKMGEKYAEFYVNEDEFYEMFLSIYYTPVD